MVREEIDFIADDFQWHCVRQQGAQPQTPCFPQHSCAVFVRRHTFFERSWERRGTLEDWTDECGFLKAPGTESERLIKKARRLRTSLGKHSIRNPNDLRLPSWTGDQSVAGTVFLHDSACPRRETSENTNDQSSLYLVFSHLNHNNADMEGHTGAGETRRSTKRRAV